MTMSPSRLSKVKGHGAQNRIHIFLAIINCTYVYILHCYRDICSLPF